MTVCYCHAMDTPKRTVRVDGERWARFTAFCRSIGTDASKRLNDHIDRDLEEVAEGSENE